MRLLPARLPYLPLAGRGDGLAARSHLPDERNFGGQPAAGRRAALYRPLSGLRRLRTGLPVGRALRRPDHLVPRPCGELRRPQTAGRQPHPAHSAQRDAPLPRSLPRRGHCRQAGPGNGWHPAAEHDFDADAAARQPASGRDVAARCAGQRAAAGAGRLAGRLRAAGAGAADQPGDVAGAQPSGCRSGHSNRPGVLRRTFHAYGRGGSGDETGGEQSARLPQRRRRGDHQCGRLRIRHARIPAAFQGHRGRGCGDQLCGQGNGRQRLPGAAWPDRGTIAAVPASDCGLP